jgi:hypothetical protein
MSIIYKTRDKSQQTGRALRIPKLCGIVVSGFEAATGSVTMHGFDFEDAKQIDFRFH